MFRRAHRTAPAIAPLRREPCRDARSAGSRYDGTRPDDPNDVVPHEHRRELRALKVFGAWTNLVDMKAGNTLDTVVSQRTAAASFATICRMSARRSARAPTVRASTTKGWEYLFDGELTRKRLVTLGFFIEPWQTVRYVENPAIGRFEGEEFEPAGWKPRVPTAAFLRARADDNFWAARRVAAFTDEMIRAVVKVGSYSDPAAEALLADVLIQRRDKIAAHYLAAINPLVDFALTPAGRLTFRNAAVDARRCDSACWRIPRQLGSLRQRHWRECGDWGGHDRPLTPRCRRRVRCLLQLVRSSESNCLRSSPHRHRGRFP